MKTQSRIPILLLKQSTLWVQWAKSFPHVILDAPVRTQWLRRPIGRTVSQSKVEASKSSASLAKSFVDKRVVTKSLWVKHLNEVCSQKGFKSYYCIFAVCKIPKTDDIRIYDIRNQRRESLRSMRQAAILDDLAGPFTRALASPESPVIKSREKYSM